MIYGLVFLNQRRIPPFKEIGYYGYFVFLFFATYVALSVFFMGFFLNLIASGLASLFITHSLIVHKRALPDEDERVIMAICCFLVVAGLNLIMIGIWFSHGGNRYDGRILGIWGLLHLVIHFIIILIIFGPIMSRRFERRAIYAQYRQ